MTVEITEKRDKVINISSNVNCMCIKVFAQQPKRIQGYSSARGKLAGTSWHCKWNQFIYGLLHSPQHV